MSEKLHNSGEQNLGSIDTSGESKRNLERLRDEADQANRDPLQKHVESLQARAEAQAISAKEAPSVETHSENSNQSYGITKHLKNDSYKHTLKKIRSNLSAPDRALSKVVHQPAVEKVSNGLAKTVARPSAFFGGSLGALIGSAVLVYMSRHYGFTYNYAAIFVAFAIGFTVALVIEFSIRFIRRKSY